MIVNAPWYVTNAIIRKDFQIQTAKEEIGKYRKQYRTRFSMQSNDLATNLMIQAKNNKRLLRYAPHELPNRFFLS